MMFAVLPQRPLQDGSAAVPTGRVVAKKPHRTEFDVKKPTWLAAVGEDAQRRYEVICRPLNPSFAQMNQRGLYPDAAHESASTT
ncbi:hypothetical protein PQR02_20165 [Paraburkholderia sediminicola]|uniref:Uncharacterized protein n=1 Tax=Paraburkholderia rhynchosiae TaxID=487049 RepID=A0ACC7NJ67_9BURK